MGYPYGKTYLEQIQEHPHEVADVRLAYYVLDALLPEKGDD